MHLHLDRRAESLTAAEVPQDYLLRPAELAGWLGVTQSTLKRWRQIGAGPLFVRAGLRSIRYKKTDVFSWLHSRTVRPEPASNAGS